MTKAEYLEAQNGLLMVGRFADVIDTDGLLDWAARAEAVGPIVDPTLYRDAAERLRLMRELADAVAKVKAPFRQLRALIEKEEALRSAPTTAEGEE